MSEKSKKSLKIYGILFLLMGVYDLIGLLLNYLQGEFSFNTVLAAANGSKSLAALCIAVVVVIFLVFTGIKFLIAANVFAQTKESNRPPLKRKLITILLVIQIISTLYMFSGAASFSGKYSDIFINIASIVIMILFLKNADKLTDR